MEHRKELYWYLPGADRYPGLFFDGFMILVGGDEKNIDPATVEKILLKYPQEENPRQDQALLVKVF